MPRRIYPDDLEELELLRLEIYNEQRKKNILEESIAELQVAVVSLENELETLDISEDDEWKVRYYTQIEVNHQLERQKDWLHDRVISARNQTNEGVQSMLAGLDLDSFTEPQLLRYMKQLERERNALYNELRDIEWKLDQESKSFHKYNDIRKTYMTEITDAMLNLEAMRSRLKFLDLGDDIAKCPRHLKYLNIQPDHRVLDPKKGPIKKTAAVRSLPKLGTSEEDRKESKEEPEEDEEAAQGEASAEGEESEDAKKKGDKKEKQSAA